MKQYIVDAFTNKVFSGNPAAVCILDNWLSDDTMKKIAIENNLSETAFTVKKTRIITCAGLLRTVKLISAVTQHWLRLISYSDSLNPINQKLPLTHSEGT